MISPKQRFSDRVEEYVKFRPSYPPVLVEILAREVGLSDKTRVADVGAGPGNLTAVLLPHVGSVVAVEPNREMREAGSDQLPDVRFVDGSAEATGLEAGSVELIVAGQAFHWFELEPTRVEFKRILVDDGNVCLVWNQRRDDLPFLKEYRELLRATLPDYSKSHHTRVSQPDMGAFFAPGTLRSFTTPYSQSFDLTGLLGRALSSSYVPKTGEVHDAIVDGLKKLYDDFQRDGMIAFDYVTEIYLGKM